MRLIWIAAFSLLIIGSAGAESPMKNRLRLADAAADACFAACSSRNASCKRVCPTTLSVPCLTACDSESQTCRKGFQK